MMRYVLLLLILLPPSTIALPLKVGVILPLTGEGASAGKSIREGMELAHADYRGDGLSLVFEDDQGANPRAAVNAARRLLDIERVNVILNGIVDTTPAVAPLAQRSNVPVFVAWDSNSRLDGLGEFVFGLGVSTETSLK